MGVIAKAHNLDFRLKAGPVAVEVNLVRVQELDSNFPLTIQHSFIDLQAMSRQ